MGILTDTGRVQRGVDFKRTRGSIWAGLGRTSSWPDEEVPPRESESATSIEELSAMKLLTEATFVKVDATGSILFQGKKYSKLSDEQAFDQGEPTLYLRFDIYPQDFPNITDKLNYRQIAVFVDSIPVEGFSNYSALFPEKFINLGRMVYYSNLTAQNLYNNTRHVIEVVLPG